MNFIKREPVKFADKRNIELSAYLSSMRFPRDQCNTIVYVAATDEEIEEAKRNNQILAGYWYFYSPELNKPNGETFEEEVVGNKDVLDRQVAEVSD